MIEPSCTKNGKAMRFDVCDSGVKETPMGTCIQMKKALKNFWKRRKMNELDYTSWEKTNHEEVK
jgi:hypothetical protein